MHRTRKFGEEDLSERTGYCFSYATDSALTGDVHQSEKRRPSHPLKTTAALFPIPCITTTFPQSHQRVYSCHPQPRDIAHACHDVHDSLAAATPLFIHPYLDKVSRHIRSCGEPEGQSCVYLLLTERMHRIRNSDRTTLKVDGV
ncbi:hypothetical protein E1B28_010838 [Marasmius oreades]|uniref:Uncharacterized protein n=1 Tax=Marasmius oreades TaxID=181124 RepID=A0A9P7RSZ1_9AGAR|nr:uncharacterized protein E1B28_010838 [Marasmius oreades]KAG7089130.1 hypothetical protein E1B28_010838 [Marasmius oreades]